MASHVGSLVDQILRSASRKTRLANGFQVSDADVTASWRRHITPKNPDAAGTV